MANKKVTKKKVAKKTTKKAVKKTKSKQYIIFESQDGQEWEVTTSVPPNEIINVLKDLILSLKETFSLYEENAVCN